MVIRWDRGKKMGSNSAKIKKLEETVSGKQQN